MIEIKLHNFNLLNLLKHKLIFNNILSIRYRSTTEHTEREV